MNDLDLGYFFSNIHDDCRGQCPECSDEPSTSDQELINNYLLSRSIDPLSVTSYPVVSGRKYFNGSGEMDAIGFVYGDREAVKWRSIQGKHFTQDGAARTLWGIDQVKDDAKGKPRGGQ